MGAREINEPMANRIYNGNISPKNPYIRADRAQPPTQAALKNPRIAPRFSSGKANISEALKTVLPAQLRNAPQKSKMHIGINSVARKANTVKTTDDEKPIAIIQNLVFALNLNIPRIMIQTSDPMVVADINNPYCSTPNPFSKVKGRARENEPAASKFNIIAQGIKMRKQEFSKIVFTADLLSCKIPFTDTFSP